MKTLLIAITGPSGFEKGKLISRLVEEYDDFEKIVSHTDRPRRNEEVEGKDFHFVSEEEFTNMVFNEEFLEWQMVPSTGYRYGKTKSVVQMTLDKHKEKVVFTRVNVINLPVFKRHFPESKSIFIDVKDTQTLIDILKNDPVVNSDEEFERRYKFATEERRRRHLADYTINRKEHEDEIIKELLYLINKFRR